MTEQSGSKGWDDALRSWPEAEKEDAESEARARAIADRLETRAEAQFPSDDELFASPLPSTAEDGKFPPKADELGNSERLRARQSLKELAKMAQGLAPSSAGSVRAGGHVRGDESRSDDSGIVDLAAAARSEPQAAARAAATPLASSDLYTPSPRTGAGAPRPEAKSSSARSSASSAPAAAKAEPPAPAPRRGVVVALFVSTTVALASAAATGFLFVKTREATSPPVAVASSASPPPTTPAAAAAPPAPESPPPEPPPVVAMDPNSLPPATTTAPVRLAEASNAKPSLAPPARPESAPLAKAETHAPPSTPEAKTDLNSAMRQETGDGREKTREREGVPAAALSGGAGDLPQRPSQGAITGALGGVLPAARRCLGPDDPVSRAAIVFASSGSVQSVAVTGAAAGTPAEACIKDALGKAKVPPFAEPTSTANITVRHL